MVTIHLQQLLSPVVSQNAQKASTHLEQWVEVFLRAVTALVKTALQSVSDSGIMYSQGRELSYGVRTGDRGREVPYSRFLKGKTCERHGQKRL